MKLRNRIQMQALVIGFGAALLLASSSFAQEIENTRWDDGPGVAPATQTTAFDESNTAAVSNDIVPAAVIAPAANQEASTISFEQWVLPGVALVISICLFAVYALARTKRSSLNRNAHMDNPNSSLTVS